MIATLGLVPPSAQKMLWEEGRTPPMADFSPCSPPLCRLSSLDTFQLSHVGDRGLLSRRKSVIRLPVTKASQWDWQVLAK